MMTNREKAIRTFNIIQRRKKAKLYKQRAMECDLTDQHYKAMEKTTRKKIGQI